MKVASDFTHKAITPIKIQGDNMEAKSVDYKFEGTKLIVTVDPNKDGQAVLTVVLEIAEIPDEVLSAISSKKAE